MTANKSMNSLVEQRNHSAYHPVLSVNEAHIDCAVLSDGHNAKLMPTMPSEPT